MTKNNPPKINLFAFLWPYIWTRQTNKQKGKFILFLFATAFTTLLITSVPLLLKYSIAALENQKTLFGFQPVLIVVAYGMTWTLTKIIDRLRHQSAFPMTAGVIHKLCLDLFSHLL